MSVDFKESGPFRYWVRWTGIDHDEQYHVIDRETGRVMRCTSMLDTALSDCCKRNGVQYTSSPTEAG